ncbi:MAG: phosphomannomutase [Desulfobacterales bacterium]|nr:phosphomannomutase [Desulfobacterales bacterium]
MTDRTILVADLMESSGVKFGTSGARGLVTAMTDEVCYAYTLAFLQYLENNDEITPGIGVAVGGDLRSSTDRILSVVCKALSDCGYNIQYLGKLPSPAVAFFGFTNKIPSIMVTGSHIPEDRNGIKYNRAAGEIMKDDESGIKSQHIEIPQKLFNKYGMFTTDFPLKSASSEATDLYVKRYTDFFPKDCLKGKKIGLYEHSSVGRDVIYIIMTNLGAEVTRLGFSETFIPVDTEAIRMEDVNLAKQWANEYCFDSIISSDGDCDRPLISDEKGTWLRGDVAGILCASYLEADAVVAPVSCNTAVEKCNRFKKVIRTRIGSPFVIEGMNKATADGAVRAVGYEANGGLLINSKIENNGKTLQALPTRDAVIVLISILHLSIREGKTISRLTAELPQRFTASNRLKEFPTDKSQIVLAQLNTGDFTRDKKTIEESFSALSGEVARLDVTDGLRITFKNNEVIHLRPSGNAPEFRCYTEADSEARSVEMNIACMKIMRNWKISVESL